MPDAAGDGGSRRWQDELEPDMRARVLEKILAKLMQVYEGRIAPSHDVNRIASSFEQKMFTESNSKDEYIRRIAHKLLIMERNRQPVRQDASGLNQIQPVNRSQATHGGNSSSTTTPPVLPTMSSHERQSPHKRSLPSGLSPVTMSTPSGSRPVPKQHMSSPIAPNMHVKNGPTDAVTLLDQLHKSSHAIGTPSSPVAVPTQLRVQSGESQNQEKLSVMQMRPINISRGSATNVTQSQEQPVVQPNEQKNPHRQNTIGTCMPPQQQLRMDPRGLEVNQQKINRQQQQLRMDPQALEVNQQKINRQQQQLRMNPQALEVNQQKINRQQQHLRLDPRALEVNQQKINRQQQQLRMDPQALEVNQKKINRQQQQLRMDPQALEVNQQKINWQNSEMAIAQQSNVSKIQTGHPIERNNQQNAGLNVVLPLQRDKHVAVEPQPLISVNQQSSLQSTVTQTVASLGCVEDDEWREEMFKQMKVLKDAYLSELVELDEVSVVPKITKEEFESLPKHKAEQYRFRVYMKKRVRAMLNFLQLQKSNIPEHLKGQLPKFVKAIHNVLAFYRRKKDQRADMDTGCQSQISHSQPQIVDLTGCPATSSGCTSSQQKQPVQPAAIHLRQNTSTRTQAASGKNHSNILLGVASSCVTERSPGSVPSLPSNKDYCTPSHVTRESPVKVSSPSASAKSILSSPIAKGAVIGASSSVSSPIDKPDLKVASPSALVMSTLPDLKVEVAQAAFPSLPVKSALSTQGSNSAVPLSALPCASMMPTSSENLGTVSGLLQQNNAAAAASNSSTTNLLMPSLLLQSKAADFQVKDRQHDGGETAVAKKPIDRLIDAMRSLPPAALKSSANSICSVISMCDWVADGELNTFPDWTFLSEQGGSQPLKRMKRTFETTTWDSESSPPVDTWEFEAYAEHGAESQNTQIARNSLLDEIESANSTLVDTIISIADDSGTDGITTAGSGTLIKLSFTAVSLAPDLKSLLATSEMPIVTPAKLLVPADYPRRSPVPVTDQRGELLRNTFNNDISRSAEAAFRNTLNGIPEPRSITETVRVWDACVRRAVTEFAQRFGGGMFSGTYGGWQSCGGA